MAMETKQLTRHEIEVVVKTKRKMYEFLTIEVEFVLPALEFTTMEWLSGIWRGSLKVSSSPSSP